MQTRQWEDQQGQKRSTTEIVAKNMQMLGRAGESGAAGGGEFASQEFPSEPAPQTANNNTTDDDLPF